MLVKFLYLRFCSIYGHKFSKGHTDELIRIWCSDWEKGIAGMDQFTVKKAIDYCLMNLEWPPSVAEFRKICEEASGILSVEQIISLCIKRNFDIPIVDYVFKTVTSWAFSNDKESELVKKVKKARKEFLLKSRMDSIDELAVMTKNSLKIDFYGDGNAKVAGNAI